MDKQLRPFVYMGLVFLGLGVIFGAMGEHYVKHHYGEHLATFKTATLFQLLHGLGALLVGSLMHQKILPYSKLVFWMFLVGVICFSGALYLYVFTGIKDFVHLTPFGGTTLIAVWFVLLGLFWKGRDHDGKI